MRNFVIIFVFISFFFSCKKQETTNYIDIKKYKKITKSNPEKTDSILKIISKLDIENKLSKDDKVWYTINVLPTIENSDDRIRYIKNTIKKISPKKGEIVTYLPILYNHLSIEYYQNNDFENAITSAFKGVEYALEVKKKYGLEKSNLEFSYYNLALAYRSAGDFVNYKKYLKSSLKTSTFEDSAGYIYQNLGDYYLSYKQIDSAYYYTKKARDDFEKLQNELSIADISLNLSTIYYEKKEYEKAKEELNEKTLQLLIDNKIISSLHYSLLAKTEVKLYDFQKAKLYLDKAKQLSDTDEELISYYEALADFDTATGNLSAANTDLRNLLKHNNKYHDQLVIDKSKELEKGFYLKQKDLQIKKLLLGNQVVNEKNKSKNILIFAILTLVVLLGIFYYLFTKNKALKAENERNVLEQKLFASQMSPHFIFNALSAIQAEVLSNNTKEANAYLTKFGKILQNVLLNTNQEYVSIASEYNNLINYIDLQKVRYKNFEYQTDIYEEITFDEDEIPPMLLQPLVENAIEHGLKTLSNGVLKIKIKKENNVLHCEIIDNGLGLNSGSKSNAISTNLIKKRLKFLTTKHKSKLHLTIENNENQVGVISKIIIPFKAKFS